MNDQRKYAIALICGASVNVRPHEWPRSGLTPSRIRILHDGVTLGVLPAESGDGHFDASALGRFQIRYAWIDDREVVSYPPGELWHGYREMGGLPDTVALYKRNDEGLYMFVHEEEFDWPPPFRRPGWLEQTNLDFAMLVECMDGDIDGLPSEVSDRISA